MGGYRLAMRSAGEGMRAAAPTLWAPLAVPVLAAVWRQPVPLLPAAASSLPARSAASAAALRWRRAPAPAAPLGRCFDAQGRDTARGFNQCRRGVIGGVGLRYLVSNLFRAEQEHDSGGDHRGNGADGA